MYITLITSRPTAGQSEEIEAFQAGFLPRLERLPGVVATYHYLRPEHGDDTTLIIWENQAAMKAYRETGLFQEAMEMEKKMNAPATRESYPLAYGTVFKGLR